MAKALTARSVDAAKPDPNARWELPDGALPGLVLRISPGGAKSFVLRDREGQGRAGLSRRVTLGRYPAMTLAEARDAARAALTGLERGEATRTARGPNAATDADRDLVRGVFAGYAERHLAQLRSGAEMRRIVERDVLPRWGARRLAEIRRREVLELLDAITDRGSPKMSNRTLAHLRAFFDWAVARDAIGANPCDKRKPPSSETKRDRGHCQTNLA